MSWSLAGQKYNCQAGRGGARLKPQHSGRPGQEHSQTKRSSVRGASGFQPPTDPRSQIKITTRCQPCIVQNSSPSPGPLASRVPRTPTPCLLGARVQVCGAPAFCGWPEHLRRLLSLCFLVQTEANRGEQACSPHREGPRVNPGVGRPGCTSSLTLPVPAPRLSPAVAGLPTHIPPGPGHPPAGLFC